MLINLNANVDIMMGRSQGDLFFRVYVLQSINNLTILKLELQRAKASPYGFDFSDTLEDKSLE